MDDAVDRQEVRPAGDGRGDREAADAQPIDVDVEIGKERCVRVGRHRLQRRAAAQIHLARGQLAHVDMAIGVGEGAPIDLEPRAIEEDAGRVADAQIRQDHAAVERAVDPTDLYVEAGGGGVAADLIRDEAAAGIGVDPEQDEQDEGDEPQHGDDRVFEQPPPERAMRLGGLRRGLGHVVRRHQNACPIEM